eukprot:CAMPEP_0117450802 /NCGR_PEP_ID=MMETSP0759-20121206/8663_1 /TAXON_ID=63605 /ORGANISM="Percolomonas cosmopolitus, Strain WS" /LENGTH=342 /DNA_ID=CAMNT_0005243349 /DNA_START=323 /DNA_END=1351 /DNA_ORIENTATION=-
MDAIRITGYEALVGGIGGGLSRGLHDGLGSCGSRAVQSIVSEVLSVRKWKALTFFVVHQHTDKHVWRREDYIELFTDWWTVLRAHWTGTFAFERGVLKWCLYVLGLCFTLLVSMLHTNMILLSIQSVITYGVEYMRLCIGIFFVVSVFLWWHADGGTVITSMDELSSQVEMQNEQWRHVKNNDRGAVDRMLSFLAKDEELQAQSRGDIDNSLASMDSCGRQFGTRGGSHHGGAIRKSMPRMAQQSVNSTDYPSNTTDSTNEIILHLSVVLLSYSVGYLTNFLFAFPVTSTMCAAFVTFCVFSHMCRGVVYQVLYYFYTWYRTWKEFESVQHYKRNIMNDCVK